MNRITTARELESKKSWIRIRVRALFFIAVVACTFLLFLHVTEAEGKTITVNDDGGANFTTIQDAINASEDGDTIRVYEGLYEENVVVNKSVNLIGDGSVNTMIDGLVVGHVVNITTDWVNISGFSVTGYSSYYTNAGILVTSNHITIADNKCLNNYYDILLKDSSNCTIEDNTCNNNGISLHDSYNCILTNNSGDRVIGLSQSFNCIILHNTANDGGIELVESYNCTIMYNTVSNGGIGLDESYNCTIMYNEGKDGGIELEESYNCTIMYNVGNDEGIEIFHSYNFTIMDNKVSGGGIELRESTNCIIMNNEGNDEGIGLIHSRNCIIENNTVLDEGIHLYNSTNCTITNNGVKEGELEIEESENCTIMNNVCITNLYFTRFIIKLSQSNNCTVMNNMWPFIRLSQSTNCTISNNSCNYIKGITLSQSTNCSITYNTFELNYKGHYLDYYNIFLEDSSNCILANNTCSTTEGKGNGICLEESFDCTISNNSCEKFYAGIRISKSSICKIEDNIYSSNYIGILLMESNNCIIKNNSISENGVGITVMHSSSEISVHNNDIFHNTEFGINATEDNDYTIDATLNYWGSNSGPYHQTKNSNGRGDEVSDNVDFHPWTFRDKFFLPDLIIESFTCTPTSPDEGTVATLTAKVTNIGYGYASDFTIYCYEEVTSAHTRKSSINAEFLLIDSIGIDQLGIGENITITVSWDTIGRRGDNVLWVFAGTSPSGTKKDTLEYLDRNEMNNEKSITVTVNEPSDSHIEEYGVEITSEQNNVDLKGQNMKIITLAITNTGEVRDGYRVVLSGDYDGWNATIEAPETITLEPNASHTFTLILMEDTVDSDDGDNGDEGKKITVTITVISVTHEEVQDSVTIEGVLSSDNDDGFWIPFLPPAALGFAIAAGGMVAFFRRRRLL